jgi:predicted enzyme related to lactoylglutathione lyase
MTGVTGIGGIFFKSSAPNDLRAWYRDHLGLVSADGGGVWFEGRGVGQPPERTFTVWGAFPDTTDYFDPSDKPFMINFRVVGLDPLVESLRSADEAVDEEIVERDEGRFAWVMDPDGHRVELWEPGDQLAACAPAPGPVTGMGGVFFKTGDPGSLKAWYAERLGVTPDPDGYISFHWQEVDGTAAFTVWEPFPDTTDYFDPSDKPFMINFRVRELDDLLERLRTGGVEVDARLEEYDYGRFGWIMDPEGQRIELWEAPETEATSAP